MSNLLDMAVFPGIQGGPLEHVIAAKAVAFWRNTFRRIYFICKTNYQQCASNVESIFRKRIYNN